MRNIKLEIEYDGTNYCGWQVQNGRSLSVVSRQKKSIQEVIEKALQQIFQEKIKIIGSSRTDAGVHARCQVANFLTNSAISLTKLHEALNALLPEDITVRKALLARMDFNSRFSAKSKTYRYTILNSKHRSAFMRNHAYFLRYPLDLKLIKKEAHELLGKHNFSAFCASQGKFKNPNKIIKKIKVSRKDNLITLEIEADSFLYNMVRNIVGTLIEIGRGKFKKGSLKRILLSKDRRLAGARAPAKGLCLERVKY